MRDRSRPGHIGHPAVASADKGEALFRAFAAGVGGFLQRVVDWSGEPWNL
jgi:creatinine amidohydrolase